MHRYKKKRDFTEDPKNEILRIQRFRVRKCFEASYGFYYVSRGRDSSYFGFILTFGLIVGWFYAVFMACFVASIGRVLWLVKRVVFRTVLGQNGLYWSCQGAFWHAIVWLGFKIAALGYAIAWILAQLRSSLHTFNTPTLLDYIFLIRTPIHTFLGSMERYLSLESDHMPFNGIWCSHIY